MAPALKTVIPALAAALSAPESMLYERQRALVREGLLKSRPGHGRGSGVQATPDSIAMLVVGILASVGLSKAGPRARAMAGSKVGEALVDTGGPKECRFTGQVRFVDALARILADEQLVARVRMIEVGVTRGWARIVYQPPRRATSDESFFYGRREDPPHDLGDASLDGLQITVGISGETTKKIAKVVSGLSQEDEQ